LRFFTRNSAQNKTGKAQTDPQPQTKSNLYANHDSSIDPQVLLELLKRIDALLFHYLVNPDASSDPPTQPPPPPAQPPGASPRVTSDDSVVMDARNPNMPVLDESMLFFTRGALTFGTGMQLKMACTR